MAMLNNQMVTSYYILVVNRGTSFWESDQFLHDLPSKLLD